MNMFNNLPLKKYFSAVCLIVCSLVAAGILGTVSMISVYQLPTYEMGGNIAASLKIYDVEKDRYAWAPSIVNSQLDNFTDAIMLSTAAYERGKTFKERVRDAMLSPSYAYDEITFRSEILPKAFKGQKPEKGVTRWDYARYWHGYLVWYKPLLSFFTVGDIRIINMMLQALLLVLLMMELFKAGGAKLACPFFLAVLIFNPVSCVLGLTYANLYYITLISALVALKWKLYQSKYYYLFFLWVGIVTSFMDLLTYPLTALGCNLIFMILLTSDKFYPKMKKVILASGFWGTGYGVMWAEKWIIGWLLTGNNIIQNALSAAKIRTSGDVGTAWEAIAANLKDYNNHIFCTLLILGLAVLLILYLSGKYKLKSNRAVVLPLLFVAVYPFMWICFMKNHCFIHNWMTHKIFMLTILAVVYSLVYSLEKISAGKRINVFSLKAWKKNMPQCVKKTAITLGVAALLYVGYGLRPVTFRTDISVEYSPEMIMSLKVGEKEISEATWMQNGGRRGFFVQKEGYSARYELLMKEDGEVTIALRNPNGRSVGENCRNKEVKYTYFSINEDKILTEPVVVCYDKPFTYVLKAKKNKLYKIKFKVRRK